MSVEIAGTTVYTLREISTQLGVSVAALRSYIEAGRLEATRVGRSYRVTEPGLQRFLGLGSGQAAPPVGPAHDDPILKVIGLGADGELSRDLDRELYD